MEYINSYFWIFLVIVGAIASVYILKRFIDLLTGKLPYIIQPSGLFSNAEKKFYFQLEKALKYEFRIFAKVRIADLVAVAPHLSGSAEMRFFNKVSHKHVDYVICNKKTLDILAVVELDDTSHLRKDRMERDEFVDKVFKAAGIPIIHIKAQGHYDIHLLEVKIAQGMYKS